ncbi:MAG: hypothetical protein DMG15_10055 [Acidobacteria bacterium]|nr:MAG: hypothetical protein DMG15_10055 [Acidobacteriota bacterium]
MNVVAPLIVGVIYVSCCSFFKESSRRNFNAIMIAGAGAAYLNGGFGIWEFKSSQPSAIGRPPVRI